MPTKNKQDYFKTIIYVSAGFFLCIFLFSIYLGYQVSVSSAKLIHAPFVHHAHEDIEDNFVRYADDILFLEGVPPIQGMIRAIDGGGYDRKEQSPYQLWVKRLKQIFEALGKRKTEYIKLRYIDEKGNELVRVDFRNGKASIIPDSELENKADRYYFTEAMKLSRGQVYISRLDLNQEREATEVPYTPTLRFAVPIFNEKGKRHGIIISSIDVQHLLHSPRLLIPQKGEEIFIVDQAGFYVHHASDPGREWGAPSDLNTGKNLKLDQPRLYRQLMNSEEEMVFCFDCYRFLFFSRVDFPQTKERFLVIVSEVSPFLILAPMFKLITATLFFILSFYGAFFFFIRQATRQIDRKEEALVSSEEQLRLLLNSTAEAIYGIDLDGNCTFYNPACRHFLGYTHAGELIGKNMHWLIHHTRSDGTAFPVEECRIFQAFQQGKGTHVDDEVLWRADGTSFPAEYWSYPQFRDGQIVGAVVTFVDITERKRAEDALREKTNELDQFFSLALDLLCIAGTDTYFKKLNLAWETTFGHTREELMVSPFTDFIHPDDIIPTRAAVAELAEQKPVINFINRYRCKDGSYRWIEWRAFPSGNLIYAAARDITARRELEEALNQAKTVAEAASRAKSDFLANMSHELRTPLNAVIGFSQVLSERYFGELNDKQAEYVKDITDSGNHLLSLINDILDLSKVEAGKEELGLSKVGLKNLLENSLIMVKERAHKHSLKLSVEMEKELEDLTITADERKLKQIMYNLLSNAVKFTPEGGSVSVRARKLSSTESGIRTQGLELNADFIEISIKDTGTGLSPEDKEKVFETFYQVVESQKGKPAGTGLGLSLVKRFVEMHGGRIWMESEGFGKGSTFTFIIPTQAAFGEEAL